MPNYEAEVNRMPALSKQMGAKSTGNVAGNVANEEKTLGLTERSVLLRATQLRRPAELPERSTRLPTISTGCVPVYPRRSYGSPRCARSEPLRA